MAKTTNGSSTREHWIKFIFREFSRHLMSIIFVIIAFLLFWVVPQINDLIVVINEAEKDWADVFIFFSTLSVFAFIISNIGYYFTSDDSKKQLDTTKKKLSFLQAPKDHKEVYLMQKKASEEVEVDDFQETSVKNILITFYHVCAYSHHWDEHAYIS